MLKSKSSMTIFAVAVCFMTSFCVWADGKQDRTAEPAGVKNVRSSAAVERAEAKDTEATASRASAALLTKELQERSEPLSVEQWAKDQRAAGHEPDHTQYTSYVTKQFDKTMEGIKRTGVGNRYVVRVDQAALKEELHCAGGGRAIYNNNQSFRNAVLISSTDKPDEYKMDTIVAQVDTSGKPVLSILPFGPGSVYALTGTIRMLGCTFSSANEGSLYFAVNEDGNFVHVGGTGAVTDKDGKVTKISAPAE